VAGGVVVGAGAGATVGKLWGVGRSMKGGIGTASLRVDGITIAALIAVNAVGDVIDPGSGLPIAGALTADGHALRQQLHPTQGWSPPPGRHLQRG
jgi:L-aminopeptidase/D-esterase-like protein